MKIISKNEQHLLDFYKKTKKQIKLNIGCRTKILPTYINIDINSKNKLADLIDDGTKLYKIKDNSCDLIESCHMLEHLSFTETRKALTVWWKKLKPGGIVRISVPDGAKNAALVLLTGSRHIAAQFVGRQRDNDSWDFHKNMFTKDWLKSDLEQCGFINVQEWDWRKTFPHNYCDSFVSGYWPTFRKNFIRDDGGSVDLGGINMSLNLQAYKK